jgi:hypothetical protein
MTYILILFLTYVLHLLLKLNWVCTAVVLVFLLVMQHFHRIKGQRFQEARKRFLDVSLYIDTLLYSFLKEQKIIRAFEDVKSTLADGHMKETVSRAIDHMMLTPEAPLPDCTPCIPQAFWHAYHPQEANQ